MAGKANENVMSEQEEFVLPEVTSKELAEWLRTRPEVNVLDVREPYEFPRARFPGDRVAYAPMSELARKHLEALPEQVKGNKSTPLVVVCHHGIRSAQVTAWLLDLGWEEVHNLAGGIDAYAREVDPSIGFY
jgi:rhodanese-related sulfurtransferase